ncbi:ABC transporter ATP-binding protein [Ornithinimicrobium pratense]|uniref:ABC transporter ATP-binding protein n=1 Tax=Ornithinimicrobium pratense TaxID=2593973 RepID=A0A5J6VA10_9MICO|nr:ABC transporter ATP-binding protein [Ornithinimicrobium pratense]QFG69912.1 ABC transporter ATP-binding protein [Ornithinimicrobium pratense]
MTSRPDTRDTPHTQGSSGAPALRLHGLGKDFGSLSAVKDVSFDVAPGARHAVIGPNGAGKSTLFALVAGALPATAGTVMLHGDDVTKLSEHARARRGLVRTFQHSSLFLSATARENILIAVQRRHGVQGQPWRAVTRRRALLAEADEVLEQLMLQDRSGATAGSLSHGERRQLEVAVALATRPSVLLLDEPAAGMSPADTMAFQELVLGLPAEVTVLLVEHDLDLVFGVADRVTVLHLGEHLLTGDPDEVRASDAVQHAYLGAEDTSELFLEDGPG